VIRPRQYGKGTQYLGPLARLGTSKRNDRHNRHRYGRHRNGDNDGDCEH
jgi:hypothetical protein